MGNLSRNEGRSADPVDTDHPTRTAISPKTFSTSRPHPFSKRTERKQKEGVTITKINNLDHARVEAEHLTARE